MQLIAANPTDFGAILVALLLKFSSHLQKTKLLMCLLKMCDVLDLVAIRGANVLYNSPKVPDMPAVNA